MQNVKKKNVNKKTKTKKQKKMKDISENIKTKTYKPISWLQINSCLTKFPNRNWSEAFFFPLTEI